MLQKDKDTDNNESGGSLPLPLLDIVAITLHRWPWILVSLAVFVGGAWLHLQRTPTSYTRGADIMVANTQNGSSNTVDLASLGLVESRTDVESEISTIKAKNLMGEVVDRLGLEVQYARPGFFRDEVVYGSALPVTVTFPGIGPADAASFTLEVDGTDVALSDLTFGESKIDGTVTGALGDTLMLGTQPVVVLPGHADQDNDFDTKLLVVKKPHNAARNQFSHGLNVFKDDDDWSVIHINQTDQSIERADDILATLIDVYNQNWIRQRNQISVATSGFINERLGVIENELGSVDNDISSFKSEHLIPDVQAASAMYMNQNQQINNQIAALNTQLQMARYIRSYLTANNADDRLLPANSGISDMNLQSGINEYNDIVLRRNALISRSSASNPLVMGLDEQLAALRTSIISAVDNYIVGLNTQMRTLEGTAAATHSRLASNPGQARYLLSVERQQKVKESLYLFLLQKREENELSQAFTAYNTNLLNSPDEAGVPPTPHRGRILLMAFLLGLITPFGFTYLQELLNNKVRGRKDLEALSIPIMGEIPLTRKHKGNRPDLKPTLAVAKGKRNLLNEAFRVARTNLHFMQPGNKTDICAVTSYNPGSGKSFVAVNLGACIALKDKKVLVIDGDLRRGSASAYVNNPHHGLADYLAGAKVNLADLIVPVPGTENLWVLPIGKIPPNPTELIESPRLQEMLDALSGEFDTIIIDCPPIDVVADARVISEHTNRTIFVLRAGLFDRRMLPTLEELYREKKYPSMTIVLNGTIPAKSNSNAYSYGYGYAYGAGNYGGYVSEEK